MVDENHNHELVEYFDLDPTLVNVRLDTCVPDEVECAQ
jgi:hypothetical protein